MKSQSADIPINMNASLCFFVLFSAISLQACSFRSPEAAMQNLAQQYAGKAISNYQMLLGMGEVYHANPDNEKIRMDYFNRMVISGYASWVLHYYLADPEKINSDADKKQILFALRRGNHYDLAEKFLPFFDSNQLKPLLALGDSLYYYNTLVAEEMTASDFSGRGRFFSSIGEQEMASMDIESSLRLDPCGNDAIYGKLLILFERENTREVIRMLEGCPGNDGSGRQEWKDVFYRLAIDIEEAKGSDVAENDRLFRLANLYLNSGFEHLALRKATKLTEIYPGNADYLALRAFVHYRMNNKQLALKYLDMAENISGQTSRLRTLIDQMQ
jgi:tetratricopeptide (TPR) repeat protein